MIYFQAFLFAGSICIMGQLLLDNTKMTPGHITSIFTVLGAFLSFLGWYESICKWAGAGATILITNFGNLLFLGGLEGFRKYGTIGIFTGLFTKCSAAIVSAVIFSALFVTFFKPKD